MFRWLFCGVWLMGAAVSAARGQDLSRGGVEAALRRSVRFFHDGAAEHGGYVWVYSPDFRHRMGEGLAYGGTIWVQPPGTPAVGAAMLQAYEATGDRQFLEYAKQAADALVAGQLHSGGWYYSITFDPDKRKAFNYRRPPTKGSTRPTPAPNSPGGWDEWKLRRNEGDLSLVDDDTTPAALRLLMRVDKALDFRDAAIHEAAEYGLTSLMRAQHPPGAWSHNYNGHPQASPDPKHYPAVRASIPAKWSRTWTKDFTGGYVLNDRITLNAIRTFLEAYEVYGKEEYLQAAVRGGEFLLLAQLPEPQPAWAQQYNRNMEPVWDRAFEPPAVTGLESQDVLETLLLLYQRTGQQTFLDAVPPALTYLRQSLLVDGKLSRYYELGTNKPIFFTKDYQITYDRGEMPAHYQFVTNSRLASIALTYRLLADGGPSAKIPGPTKAELAEETRRVLAAMDDRGAWLEEGFVRDQDGKKVTPPEGVIRSERFIRNVDLLCEFLK